MLRSAEAVATEMRGRGEAALVVREVAYAIFSYLFVLPIPSRYFFCSFPFALLQGSKTLSTCRHLPASEAGVACKRCTSWENAQTYAPWTKALNYARIAGQLTMRLVW
jgi:hypothetical protein